MQPDELEYFTDNLPAILDVHDLKRYLHISQRTVRRLIRRRHEIGLKLYKIDGAIQCNRDDFLAYLDRHSNF